MNIFSKCFNVVYWVIQFSIRFSLKNKEYLIETRSNTRHSNVKKKLHLSNPYKLSARINGCINACRNVDATSRNAHLHALMLVRGNVSKFYEFLGEHFELVKF